MGKRGISKHEDHKEHEKKKMNGIYNGESGEEAWCTRQRMKIRLHCLEKFGEEEGHKYKSQY